MLDAVVNDEIDLFLGSGTIAGPAELEVERIGSISASLIVRSSHPLAEATDIDLKTVLRYPIASSVEVPWASASKHSAGTFVCDNFHLIKEMIPKSDLIWVCPEAFVAAELDQGLMRVLHVAPDSRGKFGTLQAGDDVFICRIKRKTPSLPMQQIMDFFRHFFRNKPDII